MRVGIDTLFETPGKGTGGITYLVSFIEALAKCDQENDYFLFVSPKNRELFNINQGNFNYVMCPFSNERRFLRVLTQHTIIPTRSRRLKLDVLNSPGNVAPLVIPCSLVLTIKTMHHYRTPEQIDWKSRLYRKAFVGLSARKATLIIANSQSTKSDICNFLNVPESKVVIVPEAVNQDQFRPLPKEKVRPTLTEYKVNSPYILFVSALWPYKNAHTLIDAFKLLIDHHSIPHDLIIIGSSFGDTTLYKSKLDGKVEKLGIQNRVIFLGHVKHEYINCFYSGADLFVYPSYYETFGLTLLEAMASGTPVVASNRAAIPEIVGDTGILVDPDDPKAVAEAIYEVLSNESKKKKLITRGLERAKEFTWEKTARKTVSVYKKALEIWRDNHRRK